jgi:hypothetical protein
MTARTTCPDRATLIQLRRNQLPPTRAAELRRHLEDCPACSRTVPPIDSGSIHHASGPVRFPAAPASVATATPSPRQSAAAPPPAQDSKRRAGFLSPPQAADEVGRLGGYRVLRLLDQEGVRMVFEAEHLGLGRRVVLYVFPPGEPGVEQARQQMLAEAGVTGSDDPAAVCHVGGENGALFVAVEWGTEKAPSVADPKSLLWTINCPKCRGRIQMLGDRSICANCGYSTGPRNYGKQQPKELPRWFWPWVVLVVGGCVAVIAATALRHRFLSSGSLSLVWWIGLEGGGGLAAYWLAHAWVLLTTARRWREGDIFKYIDPLTVWKYAAEFFRQTRWAVPPAAWGATAFSCAFVLFWMNDFAVKDKKEARRHAAMMRTQAATAVASPEERADEYTPATSADSTPTERAAERDVNVIDPYGSDEPERQPPPRSTTCVVIGYVPDPKDPKRISQLVLGTRDEDGTIRYAGTVSNFAAGEDVSGGLQRVQGARPLLQRPRYLPSGLNAIPVEPTVTARVGYEERDGQGVLKNVTVQGVTAPDGEKKSD